MNLSNKKILESAISLKTVLQHGKTDREIIEK